MSLTPARMRVKIISEGLPHNTKVVDAETGEPIPHVISISWRCGGRSHIPTAILEMELVGAEITVDAQTHQELMCGLCGHLNECEECGGFGKDA